MTEADKIEELADWHAGEAPLIDPTEAWHQEQAAFLRSLSTRLKELEEAKEALEWLIKWNFLNDLDITKVPACPPYLQKRLGKEGE